MFLVSGSRPAQDLSREQLWDALVLKAENPLPFVPSITACRILERTETELVREIILRGETLCERVRFFPQQRVVFERLSGSVRGTIENRIESTPRHGLGLRFTFRLEVPTLRPGRAQEQAFAKLMGKSYLRAIQSTIRETQRIAGAA